MKSVLERGVKEAGGRIVEFSKAQIPEGHKRKIAWWLNGEDGDFKRIWLLANRRGYYLLFHEEGNLVFLLRLFEIGERVELSYEFSLELPSDPECAERVIEGVVKTFSVLTG